MIRGIVSIRNEDGTQYLTETGEWCSSRNGAWPVSEDRFNELKSGAPITTRENSPDNGFFGFMNLKFTLLPSTDVILTQEALAKATYKEWAKMDEEEAIAFNKLFPQEQ